MFHKPRMRALLRRIIADAAPAGLRPDRSVTVMQALLLERAAVARGLLWRGFSPAQAAVMVALAAGPLGCCATAAERERLEQAAGRFAIRRGLVGFAADMARDLRAAALDGAPPGQVARFPPPLRSFLG